MRRLQLERLRYARRRASVAEARHEGLLAESHAEDSVNDLKGNMPAPEPEESDVSQDEQDQTIPSESPETQSVSEGYHANTTELYASEAEYKTCDDGTLHVKIISINGLDGKHAWWGDSLSGTSLDAYEFGFDTSLLLNEDSPAEEIRKAASELLDFVIHITDSSHEHPAIVFVARDIGGTLLKHALLLAVESTHSSHKRVLDSTTHLLFFATPHRASEQLPWDYTISNLIYQQAQGTSGIWLPKLVRELAVYHGRIAARFETLGGQHRFRYINYYQEESKFGFHKIVIPQYAATFGHDGERQIGRDERHSTLANLSRPDIAKEFLSILQDASATTKSEYREALSLLSRVGIEALPPRRSKSTYLNLCKLILSAGSLTEINGAEHEMLPDTAREIQHRQASSDTERVPAVDSETTHTRRPEYVQRSIQIVDLEECIVDTAAFASSLITSILQEQPRSQCHFITLVNHPPRRIAATKLQLLVSLAHQYLTHYPRVFRRVQPLFEAVQESLGTSNTSWKEMCLERLVKSLLSYHGTDLPFIIIVQPYGENNGGPVHQLATGLLSWVNQTEIYAKIIAVQYLSPSSGHPKPDTEANNHQNVLEQQVAVWKDHEAEMEQVVKSNANLPRLRDDVAKILRDIRIMTPSQWIQIFENHLFTSVPLPTILGFASGSHQSFTDLMLDAVVGSNNPWIKAGLGWIAHAVRPLAYSEFQKVMSYESGIPGYGGLAAVIAEEFRKLLSGLVETNGNVIYLASSETRALVTAWLLRQREEKDSNAGSKDAQFDNWSHTTCHPDLYIARHCIKVLRDSFNNEASSENGASDSTGSEEETPEETLPPMLSYAAENWLTHVQLWIDGSVTPGEPSAEEKELDFITAFIHDQKLMNRWLRHRDSRKGRNAECEGEYDMRHTADVLGLNCGTREGVLKLLTTVQLAGDNRPAKTNKTETTIASILITSAQLGDCDTLADVNGGLLDDILPEIFQTGADAALCYLAPKHQEFIQQNWNDVMSDAIRMSNLELLSSQGGCGNSSFEPSLWLRIAEHGSYLPEDALESLGSLSTDDRRHIAHLAAASGHSALIGTLIEAGLDLNQETSPGVTPLFLAAQHGHYTVASQLLAATAENCRGNEAQARSTPLHAASASGYPDVVRLLLKHGGTAIDLSAQDKGGNTALHLSLANGHLEVAMSLLEAHKALVAPTAATEMGPSESAISPFCIPTLNAQNKNLQTPLISAVQSGSFKIAQSLLRHKVDVNLADRRGKTALHFAATLEMPEILSLLLEESNINLEARDCKNMTPLLEAASQGRPSNIDRLLKLGADHNAVDKKDRSALELVSEAGHTVSAKVLLPLYDRRRITASFLKAVSAGNTKMAELLLDAGADKNAVMPQTLRTALHQGASKSDARLVQSLLLRKAELDLKDESGRTPLYEAACCGAANCLKLLVDAGADVNVSDSSGVTALIAAATKSYERCVDILLAAPAQRSAQAKYALNIDVLLSNSVSVLSKVLRRLSVDGGEWDVSNYALQQLLQKGIDAVEALEMLMENGLKHDRIIGTYGTMLHYAVYLDQPELVSFLAKDGRARPGIVYDEQGTPLQLAAQYAKPNALTIVRKLLDEGADAELGSGEIGSPLHAATRMSETWSNSNASERYMDIARTIMGHAPSSIDKIAGIYPTVLESAVRCGTADMVKLVLNSNPDMSIIIGTYGTPLHLAVLKGYWRETNLILDCGSPSLNQGTPDQEGRLPLHMLSRNSYWDEADYDLLMGDEKTRINATDKQQRHVVHFCAGQGNDTLLAHVLDNEPGALEAMDVDGWTPLHWACRQKSTETVEILLDLNADKNALTYRGWRPIDVATYHGVLQGSYMQALLQPDNSIRHTNPPTRCLEGISYDDEETVPVTSAPNSVAYICDSCGCVIHGPRYRCDTCHSFDMCFKCFRHAYVVHYPSHTFQKFNDLGEEVSIIEPLYLIS